MSSNLIRVILGNEIKWSIFSLIDSLKYRRVAEQADATDLLSNGQYRIYVGAAPAIETKIR